MIQLPNRQTVYNGLLGIRKHLSDSLSRESSVITNLEGILDSTQSASGLQDVACTFTDGLQNLRQTIKFNSTNNTIYHNTEDIATGITSVRSYTLEEARTGDVDYLLNGVESLTVNSDTNDAIANVNDMFLLHPKVNISVITSSLQDFANTNIKEYGTIVSTLSALADSSGNITQMSWMQWCKRVFSVGLKAGEQSSFQLDDTDPYKVISFINIMQSVFNVALNTMFSLIATAFRGLLALVALVINSVINLWNAAKAKFGDVRIDDEQLLWHLAGSVFSCELRPGYHDATNFDDLCHYIPLPGLDVYWWCDKSDNNTLKCQCFINLSVHPDRLYTYIMETTSSMDTENYVQLNSQYFMREDDELSDPADYQAFINMFLTEDEFAKLSTDGDFFRRTVAANLCCVGLLCAYFGQWQVGGGTSSYSPQIDDSFYEYEGYKFLANIAAIGFAECKYKHLVDSGYAVFDKLTWNDCFKIHNWMFTQTNKLYYNWIMDNRENVSNAGQAYTAFVYKSPLHGLLSLTAGSQYDIMVTTNYTCDASNSLDYFPVSPKVILPQLDFNALLAWIIISGVAATAVFMTARLLLRNRRIARTVKRQRAAEELQYKYEQAVSSNDPDDMRAYIKAKKRFDLKSRIFKWDSYDPQNQWWEPRSVSSNMDALLTTTTAKVLGTGIATVSSTTSGLPTAITNSTNATANAVSNSTNTLNNAISALDGTLSNQIASVIHDVGELENKVKNLKSLIDGSSIN